MSTGGGDEHLWYPVRPVEPSDSMTVSGHGEPTDFAYAHLGGGPTNRPNRRRLPVILAVVCAAAIVAAVLAVVVPGGGKNAQAEVIASVNHAVASKTARGSLTMAIGTGSSGGQLSGQGSGTLDFTNGAMDLNLDIHVSSVGQSLPIHLIYLGGTIYEGLPQISELFPGKSWVSIDLSGLAHAAGNGGALNLGGNPAAMLRLLSEQGNNVVSIGSSKIDGVTVNGYKVSFDSAAMERRLQSADVPSWMRGAISQVNLQDATETVFIDTSGQLRRTTMHVVVNGPSVKSGTVDETLDLSDYGAPASISAPPAGQVVDFQQFLHSVSGSSGS